MTLGMVGLLDQQATVGELEVTLDLPEPGLGGIRRHFLPRWMRRVDDRAT